MFAKLRTVAVAFAVIVAACGPVHAQTQQQLDWCRGEDGATLDEQISGCTAIIQSGRSSGDDLAEVLSLRGVAYVVKGQLDRAIHDFDQSIRLDPNVAIDFHNRGNAYVKKGQLDRAIHDFDQAIWLDPNAAIDFHNRGDAYVKKGQLDRAIHDFDQAIRLAPDFADAFYKRSLAKEQLSDKPGAEADMATAKRINPNIEKELGR